MSLRRHWGLAAILVVALIVRVIGLGYGLPWLFYFHDEPQVVLRALRLGTGDLNPHFFGWPGILLFYVALLSFIGLFVWGRLTGLWRNAGGFANAYFKDPSAFYVLARLQSVASGVWTVYLTYGLGSTAYSTAVGTGAALAMAVSALHAHYSHLAHPVIVLTAFVSLGLWACVRLAVDGGAHEFRILAIALGLGTAAQYHAALLAVPLAIAMLLRIAGEPKRMWHWLGAAFLTGLAGIAIHLILSPFTVLDYKQFLHDLSYEAAKASGGSSGPRAPARAILSFISDALVPSLSMPLLVLGGVGALAAFIRRKPADLVLLSFVGIYFLVMARSGLVNDRYGLPLVMPGLLFAARLVEEFVFRMPARWRRGWYTPAIMALLSVPSAFTLAEQDYTMTRGDTRIESLRWFEAHVPFDDRVVIDMHRYRNTASPPLNENTVRLKERIEEVQKGVEGSGSSRAYEPFFRYWLEHPRPNAYYLMSTNMGYDARRLDQYVREGYRWAVVSVEAREMHERFAAGGDSSHVRYYLDLDRDAKLVAEFKARRWHTLGPEIRVYRLPDHPSGRADTTTTAPASPAPEAPGEP